MAKKSIGDEKPSKGIRPFRNAVNKRRADIVARSDDAYGSSNYAEFSVARKVYGKYRIKRLLMLCLYVAVPALILSFLVILKTAFHADWALAPIITFGALTPLFIWMMAHFTWLYVSESYYYEVDSANFTLLSVYGNRKEKDLFSSKVKDFSLIAPYSDEYAEKADEEIGNGAKTVFAASSKEASDLYFGICEKGGTRYVIFFEATEQSLKALRYYNSAATVVTQTRR